MESDKIFTLLSKTDDDVDNLQVNPIKQMFLMALCCILHDAVTIYVEVSIIFRSFQYPALMNLVFKAN